MIIMYTTGLKMAMGERRGDLGAIGFSSSIQESIAQLENRGPRSLQEQHFHVSMNAAENALTRFRSSVH